MWGLSGSLAIPGVLGVKAAHARSCFPPGNVETWGPQTCISPPSPVAFLCCKRQYVCSFSETPQKMQMPWKYQQPLLNFNVWEQIRLAHGSALGPRSSNLSPTTSRLLFSDTGVSRDTASALSTKRREFFLLHLWKNRKEKFSFPTHLILSLSSTYAAPKSNVVFVLQISELFFRFDFLSRSPHIHSSSKIQRFLKGYLLTRSCPVKSALPMSWRLVIRGRAQAGKTWKSVLLTSEHSAQPLCAQCSVVQGHFQYFKFE